MLKKGDDTTSNAIIMTFRGEAAFDAFARAEMDDILKRDAEDDEKLAAGISMAVQKGVLPANPKLEALNRVDVLGKSAEAVAGEIIRALGDAPSKGCVLVLQGLSGTGKGTTCTKLQQQLPRCTSWSNGNVFRSLTLLAVTRCEQSGTAFGPSVLTPAFLADLVACLSFGKYGPGGAFDIRIKGYGLEMLVSQVANTALKDPKVGKNIPTVAKMTQGEVVSFAAAAADAMRADGMNVLMEGRAQTLNYVRTPHRFELTLSDPMISMRPAIQTSFPTRRARRPRCQEDCSMSHPRSWLPPRRAAHDGVGDGEAQGHDRGRRECREGHARRGSRRAPQEVKGCRVRDACVDARPHLVCSLLRRSLPNLFSGS